MLLIPLDAARFILLGGRPSLSWSLAIADAYRRMEFIEARISTSDPRIPDDWERPRETVQ
jgi:hypothetical protein